MRLAVWVPRLGTWGAGSEALQGGGDRGQVEVVHVVDHVPPDARQMRRPGGAQPLQASAGEHGVVAAAVAGATLTLNEALALQSAHDPGHAAEREGAADGQVAHAQPAARRLR